MTEMQAAIGRIQLTRIDDWNNKRDNNAQVLIKALEPFADEGGPIRLPKLSCERCTETNINKTCKHAYYKYYAYVRPENLAKYWSRDRIIQEINALGTPCFSGSCSEVYLERAFDGTGLRPGERLSGAKELGETSLMFLVHPTLTISEMKNATTAISRVMKRAQLCPT